MKMLKIKKQARKQVVPTLQFNSEYFKCPKCGWTYPGPLKINGDIAPTTKCQQCGHSYLVRIK